MTILDQPERWGKIDPRSMYSLIQSFPEQIQAAAQATRSAQLPNAENAPHIIVTGLGGSAIGGDLVRAIAGQQLRVPLIVNRDYYLPAFWGTSSLVIACSYSGNTEETLSAYRQARAAACPVVCITSGGKLEAMAKADRCTVLKLPCGLPPRAALGHSLVTLLVALQQMQIIPEIEAQLQEAVGLLFKLKDRYGAGNLEPGNTAKMLANSLHGKIVAIYGSSGTMEPVAFRWRTQIEENAKNLALHHSLPEMNHNELVGWVYPEEVLRKIGVVLLRDGADHPQIQRRFELTREVIAAKAGVVHEIWSEGDSPVSRVLSVICLGDYVSLYMAYLNGVDPTPVEIIDYLKKKLA